MSTHHSNHVKKETKLVSRIAQKIIPKKFLSKNANDMNTNIHNKSTLCSDLLDKNRPNHVYEAKTFNQEYLRQLEKLEQDGLSNLDIYKQLPIFSMDLGEKILHYSYQLIEQDKQALNPQLLEKIFIEGKELYQEKEQTKKVIEVEKKRNFKIFSAFPIMSVVTYACITLLPHLMDTTMANILIGSWGVIFALLSYKFYQAANESDSEISIAQNKLNLLKSVTAEEALNLVNMIKQDDFAKLYHEKIINEKRSFSTLE